MPQSVWHLLSANRWAEKSEYAKLNGGAFYMPAVDPVKDIAQGRIGPYIYALPRLAGACDFAGSGRIVALEIVLRPDARIARYRGHPDQCDWSELKTRADGLDMIVDVDDPAWPVRFRQVLLWNPEVFAELRTSHAQLEMAKEIVELRAGRVPATDLFLIDRDPLEQLRDAKALRTRLV